MIKIIFANLKSPVWLKFWPNFFKDGKKFKNACIFVHLCVSLWPYSAWVSVCMCEDWGCLTTHPPPPPSETNRARRSFVSGRDVLATSRDRSRLVKTLKPDYFFLEGPADAKQLNLANLLSACQPLIILKSLFPCRHKRRKFRQLCLLCRWIPFKKYILMFSMWITIKLP